jgi:ribonuclease HI
VEKTEKDSDGLAKLLSTAITPREHIDELSKELAPDRAKGTPTNSMVPGQIPENYTGHLLSFDGGYSRTHKTGGAAAVLWKLPAWQVVAAGGTFVRDVTNNETEYHALLWGLNLARSLRVDELIVVGDSNLVIKQITGFHQCKEPHLEVLLTQANELAAKFNTIKFIHVVRAFNAAADYVAGKTLRLEKDYEASDPEEVIKLQILNKLPDKFAHCAPVPTTATAFLAEATAGNGTRFRLRRHSKQNPSSHSSTTGT